LRGRSATHSATAPAKPQIPCQLRSI